MKLAGCTKHQVKNDAYPAAKSLCEDIINSGEFALEANFTDVFYNELNDEILFAIQYAFGNPLESQSFSSEFTSFVRQGREDGQNIVNDNLVADFAAFAREMGFIMHVDTPGQISKAYNALTRQAENQPELKMLLPLAIRTMAKAVYSTENIGHYGLSFDFYTHFTSPIRRYSDVLVHRILEKNIKATYRVNEDELESQCLHISAQERKAMEAERESVRYKQVEYLESHIGSLYEGIVSGMNERGIFVELIENWCEGFVGFETMQESFTLEGRYKAIGNRTGQVYKMGDKVQVRIASVDFAKRKVFMEFIEEPFSTEDS